MLELGFELLLLLEFESFLLLSNLLVVDRLERERQREREGRERRERHQFGSPPSSLLRLLAV